VALYLSSTKMRLILFSLLSTSLVILCYRWSTNIAPMSARTPSINLDLQSPSLGANNPYNEAEIIDLMSQIYKTMTKLGAFEDEYYVRWPPSPEGQHTLNTSRLDPALQTDERVWSLMQHIPIGRHGWDYYHPVAPYMVAVDDTHPDQLAMSRDIDRRFVYEDELSGELNMDNTKPTEVLLLSAQEGRDPYLVLDVADSK
jgi:hypothetical protein